MKPYHNNLCHKRVNIHAAPPEVSPECKLSSLGQKFLENLETDSGSSGLFRRFPTHIWQNARLNIVRRAMVCDVYFPFPKIL